MENPTESTEKLYDKNYYLSFPDGSLSKKLLEFSSYINRNSWDEDEIDRKISQSLYKYPSSQKPSYYQENPKFYSSYVHSTKEIKKIEIIKNELSICFLKLSHWSNKNNLEILDENREIRKIGDQFSIFFNRIKNNNFGDKTYLFYSEGKKIIETIALLIENNSIDKYFRINSLIELTMNGNLNYCVEGCFSRFLSTAEHLKNFLDFNFPYILTELITDTVEKLASSKHDPGAKIYTEILCEKVKVAPRNYEIHAKNYLINKLMNELGLSQKIVDDSYTHFFDTQHSEQIFKYFLSVFKSKFTATNIVYFLQNKYFEKEGIYFIDRQSNVVNIKKLEEFLVLFGQDKNFQLNEIITLDINEKPRFKIDNPLLITLSERLLNTEWFRLGFHSRWIDKYGSLSKPLEKYAVKVEMPLFQENELKYRIFIGNFELSWFKLNNDRQRMIDLVTSENNLYDLLNENFSMNMVQYLFENLNDLLLFFKVLPKNKHGMYLSYLDQKIFNFKFHISSNLVFNQVFVPVQAYLNHYDIINIF